MDSQLVLILERLDRNAYINEKKSESHKRWDKRMQAKARAEAYRKAVLLLKGVLR